MKTRKRIRRPRREVLEVIATELKEIEAWFELEGFSASEYEVPEEEQLAEEPDLKSDFADVDYEGDEDLSVTKGFHREDIEIAIDVFISQLLRFTYYSDAADSPDGRLLGFRGLWKCHYILQCSIAARRLIRESEPGQGPSLSEVFEKFVGEDHELVEKAKSFEEHIKGYFDSITYEDMEAAYNEFVEIQEIIQKEVGGRTNVEN